MILSKLRSRSVLSLCLLALVFLRWPQAVALANNSIFAPQPAAQNSINFDGQGFLINGQRVFIASAGMEYARVPRALWADRLMRIKRAGFNCVETYVMWNFHEEKSGQFNFSDNRDLDAFLKLAKSLGLYAIVRPGPYVCAEWDSGGYPIWLRFLPGLEVRNNNTVFQQYVVRWFNQLFPIIVNNQINRGGNVIMVQLENEDYAGWGTEGLNSSIGYYYKYLQSTALSAGMEVPYFFSGLHHEDTPGGNPLSRTDMQSPPSPWFSTEFYVGWITQYGSRSVAGAADRYGNAINAAQEVRNTWQVIAYGGNGYNFYMAHGGSNFDYSNNDEIGSSYDYGSPIGETGDIRPEYHRFRQAASFARSFQTILENSADATATYKAAASNKSLAVTGRTSTAGDILFLDDPSTSASQATSVTVNGTSYPKTGQLTLNPSEILPVVTNYAVAAGVTLNVAPTRLLGVTQQDNTTTLVIYGQAGSAAELYFTVPSSTTISAGAPALSLNGTSLSLQTTFPSSGAANYSFQTGNQRVRILAVNDSWINNTWFIDAGSQNYVVVGPQYVGAAVVNNGYLELATETPWQNATSYPVTAYGSGDAPLSLNAASTPGSHPTGAALTAWQTLSGTQQAQPGYDASTWFQSTTGPQQMGIDGDISAYAWYRSSVNVSSAQSGTFTVGSMADRMKAFVDGVAVPAANFYGTSFSTSLAAGTHTLAVATVHQGRDKLLGYAGPITLQSPKGISGTSSFIVGGTPTTTTVSAVYGPSSLTNWRVMPPTTTAPSGPPPDPAAGGWTAYTIGSDAFAGQAGYAWFQTTLPTVPAAAAQIVANFAKVDDNATVYLNGTLLATHQGVANLFAVGLASVWNYNGTNVLSVLVQNTSGVGGIYTGVTLAGYTSAVPITTWNYMTTTSAAVGTAPPATTATGWTVYTNSNNAFANGAAYAWFQATLPTLGASQKSALMTFNSLDDNSWVYINGTLVTTHQGWSVPVVADLGPGWNSNGPNVLTILLQNTGGPGGIYGIANLGGASSSLGLTNWAQQGGGIPNTSGGWQPLNASDTFSGPQFFSTTFTASAPTGDGLHPGWRVTTPAAGNGSVWLNGHNLGRYPQIVASVPGVYAPECWLNPGTNANTLTIYDFAGARPDSVKLNADAPASRDGITYRSTALAPVTLTQWRQNYFATNASNDAIAGPLADPDGDGLSNLLEYALGTNPLGSNANPVAMDTETVGDSRYLRLTVAKSPAASGLTYSVEATSDLATPASWSNAGLVVETNSTTVLTVRDSIAMTGATTRYLRLRVTTQ